MYPKGMEFLDFKFFLPKLLIVFYNSHIQNTSVIHMPPREALPASVPQQLPATTAECRYCYTGRIEK